MAKALHTIRLEINGEKYARVFQFDNAKAAREFYIESRNIPGVVKAEFGDWPTRLYGKCDKALADLQSSIQ